MKRAPRSYLDRRRPPLMEAIQLEKKETLEEAIASLRAKGYFTPPPRPWQLGSLDRGLGREQFAVLDRFGDLVIDALPLETAQFIIQAANAYMS